jgi:hypothetical protein
MHNGRPINPTVRRTAPTWTVIAGVSCSLAAGCGSTATKGQVHATREAEMRVATQKPPLNPAIRRYEELQKELAVKGNIVTAQPGRGRQPASLAVAAGVHRHRGGVRPRQIGSGRARIAPTAKLPQGKAIVAGILGCLNDQDCREQEAIQTRVGDAAVRSEKGRCKPGRVLLIWVVISRPPFVHGRGQTSSTARCVTQQEAHEWQPTVSPGR